MIGNADARIYVAGHTGLVGSSLMRRLSRDGYRNILTAARRDLDLRDQAAVHEWFRANRPEYVFLAAGTVGGIQANSTRPAQFRRVFGKSLNDAWQDWIAWEHTFQQQNLASVRAFPETTASVTYGMYDLFMAAGRLGHRGQRATRAGAAAAMRARSALRARNPSSRCNSFGWGCVGKLSHGLSSFGQRRADAVTLCAGHKKARSDPPGRDTHSYDDGLNTQDSVTQVNPFSASSHSHTGSIIVQASHLSCCRPELRRACAAATSSA
jgi:hypothetical protein